MKKIILIVLGLSVLLYADFVKNGEIVIDTKTGLQWQDDADAKSVTKTWIEAINYCENLTLSGHNDWRLPNVNELKSIVDRSKNSPAIVDGFTNVNSNYYWSSTTNADNKSNAWIVSFFFYSHVYNYNKGSNYYVRCVRAGQ